jgi:Pyridoxamine 5'-phosphate oxidase
MAQWLDVVRDAPSFAVRVRACFDAGTNKTLATLRLDGAPRISGTELAFGDAEVTLGMMPASLKLRDVERDPRVAIHSPTVEPPSDPAAWPGDAKFAGTLIRVPEPAENAVADASFFRLDLNEVVLTYVDVVANRLVVESWHPGRGWRKLSRE